MTDWDCVPLCLTPSAVFNLFSLIGLNLCAALTGNQLIHCEQKKKKEEEKPACSKPQQ